MSLAKRHALVTGSTSGIGLAIARALAKEGADVMINGMGDPPRSRRSAPKIEKDFGVKAFYNGADMTKPAEIAAMIADAQAKLGSLDILVNNAGIQFVSPIEDFPPEKWDAIIAINLSAAFHAIRAAVPGMKAQKWGRIVTTASAHSLVASPFKSAYVAAKHGLDGPDEDGRAGTCDLRRHRQLHLAGLRLDAAGREPDPRHDEGARPDARAGDQRRDAGGAADQAIRHRRSGRRARRLSLLGRRRADHRRQSVDRRRLDRGIALDAAPRRPQARSISRCRAAARTAPIAGARSTRCSRTSGSRSARSAAPARAR